MKKALFTVMIATALLIVLFTGQAIAIPQCTCFGYVYYDGNPASNITASLYTDDYCLITSSFFPGNCFYVGDMYAASGYYRICIIDGSGHWYHARFYHNYAECTPLGNINLGTGLHVDKQCEE
jgi:hypothetical protein